MTVSYCPLWSQTLATVQAKIVSGDLVMSKGRSPRTILTLTLTLIDLETHIEPVIYATARMTGYAERVRAKKAIGWVLAPPVTYFRDRRLQNLFEAATCRVLKRPSFD